MWLKILVTFHLFLNKLNFLCIKLKLIEVYGVHHSLFHIEYDWNFAFDLQHIIYNNKTNENGLAKKTGTLNLIFVAQPFEAITAVKHFL